MCAHVHAVGDKGDRTEQEAAGDLGDHHGAAEPNDGPGLALALLMLLAQEHMAVQERRPSAFAVHHGDLTSAGAPLSMPRGRQRYFVTALNSRKAVFRFRPGALID